MTVTVAVPPIPVAIPVAVATISSVAGEGIEDRSGWINDDGALGRFNRLDGFDRPHNGAGVDIDHPVKLRSPCSSAAATGIEWLKRQCLPGILDDRAARPGIEGLTTLLDRALSDTAVLDSTAQLKTLRDTA